MEKQAKTEEIIVTVQRRVERVSKVPTCITELGRAQMDKLGVRDIKTSFKASDPKVVGLSTATTLRTAAASCGHFIAWAATPWDAVSSAESTSKLTVRAAQRSARVSPAARLSRRARPLAASNRARKDMGPGLRRVGFQITLPHNARQSATKV
jgi:hypothetical protein